MHGTYVGLRDLESMSRTGFGQKAWTEQVLARKPEPEVNSKRADHDVGAVMDDTQDLDCRESNCCTLRKERHVRNNAFRLLFPSGDYFSSLLWSRSW